MSDTERLSGAERSCTAHDSGLSRLGFSNSQRDDTLNRLRAERRDPQTIIDLARREGRTQHLSADMVADIAVPVGSLPEDHPDYMTDRDPWSVAWDVADDLLHA